jgi:predicted transcriptional regulator
MADTDRLAKAAVRTKNLVALRPIESHCEGLEKIRNGLSDLDEGRFVSHQRVAPWLRDLAQGRVRRHPRPGSRPRS